LGKFLIFKNLRSNTTLIHPTVFIQHFFNPILLTAFIQTFTAFFISFLSLKLALNGVQAGKQDKTKSAISALPCFPSLISLCEFSLFCD